jgi:hypothetical protein
MIEVNLAHGSVGWEVQNKEAMSGIDLPAVS